MYVYVYIYIYIYTYTYTYRHILQDLFTALRVGAFGDACAPLCGCWALMLQYSSWGFGYNFTNHDFNNNLDF